MTNRPNCERKKNVVGKNCRLRSDDKEDSDGHGGDETVVVVVVRIVTITQSTYLIISENRQLNLPIYTCTM